MFPQERGQPLWTRCHIARGPREGKNKDLALTLMHRMADVSNGKTIEPSRETEIASGNSTRKDIIHFLSHDVVDVLTRDERDDKVMSLYVALG